jgi:hypothetical protein
MVSLDYVDYSKQAQNAVHTDVGVRICVSGNGERRGRRSDYKAQAWATSSVTSTTRMSSSTPSVLTASSNMEMQ